MWLAVERGWTDIRKGMDAVLRWNYGIPNLKKSAIGSYTASPLYHSVETKRN